MPIMISSNDWCVKKWKEQLKGRLDNRLDCCEMFTIKRGQMFKVCQKIVWIAVWCHKPVWFQAIKRPMSAKDLLCRLLCQNYNGPHLIPQLIHIGHFMPISRHKIQIDENFHKLACQVRWTPLRRFWCKIKTKVEVTKNPFRQFGVKSWS